MNVDQSYNVVVSMDGTKYSSISDLGNLLVSSKSGTVHLDSIATFSTSTACLNHRENKERVNQ
jgi:multidrug efflux pump subunit AcrB